MPLKMPWWSAILLKTGQTVVSHIGGDSDNQKGIVKGYEILTTGQYTGDKNLDVPHYAAATISFAAPDIIADAANGLITFLNADKIVVKGSAGNNVVYTVASGGGAADHFHVTPNVAVEAAGAYISLYKRAAHSNNVVQDLRTGLMWSRYASSGEKVGVVSTGTLNWYDAATCFVLHPVAADLAIVLPNILRIVGGALELSRYHIGDILVCAGFANAVNLLPGYRVLSVAVNGADLDIVLWTGSQTLIAEGAAGVRSISLVCRSIYGYAAAANAIALAGYTDWRPPNIYGSISITTIGAVSAVPDPAAFPGWGTGTFYWSTTSRPTAATQAFCTDYATTGIGLVTVKTAALLVALVRGGA